MTMRNPVRARLATVAAAAVLTACGTSDAPAGPDRTTGDAGAAGATTPAPDDVAPGTGSDPDAPTGTATDGADPLRVLLAVVVLTTGDVDAAVAEGLVSPSDLDVAESALAAREVSVWLARADLLLREDEGD